MIIKEKAIHFKYSYSDKAIKNPNKTVKKLKINDNFSMNINF